MWWNAHEEGQRSPRVNRERAQLPPQWNAGSLRGNKWPGMQDEVTFSKCFLFLQDKRGQLGDTNNKLNQVKSPLKLVSPKQNLDEKKGQGQYLRGFGRDTMVSGSQTAWFLMHG